MNAMFFIDLYYNLPKIESPIIVKRIYNKILEKIFNRIVNYYLPKYFSKNPNNNPEIKHLSDENNRIIASLTSFPDRINTTHLSIETILRQTVRPHKILLWLSIEQFPNKNQDLPSNLLNLLKYGLDIRFCENIRSHKKYYYALKEFKDDIVILFDDDLFFHKNIIKNLLEIHVKHPTCVVGTRVHRMTFCKGFLNKYKYWQINYTGDDPSIINHSNSGHGTLIPPSVKFDEIFFNKELFMSLSPKSDDVWFKVNLIRLGIKVVTNKQYARDTLSIKGTYKNSLVAHNTHKGLKDAQFNAVFEYFGIDETEKGILIFERFERSIIL